MDSLTDQSGDSRGKWDDVKVNFYWKKFGFSCTLSYISEIWGLFKHAVFTLLILNCLSLQKGYI